MRLSAKAPIVIRGEEITHLDADGYKHLPRATSLPDGKVLATSGGKWAPSDLSGISVSSVFGRTGAIVAQTGDYTAAQVGAEPYAGVPAQTSFWRSTAAGVRAWVQLVAADITDLATTLAAYLTKLNPTFTGTLTGPTAAFTNLTATGNPVFGTSAAGASVVINSAAGTVAGVRLQDAGVDRATMQLYTGSAWRVVARDTGGVEIDSPFYVDLVAGGKLVLGGTARTTNFKGAIEIGAVTIADSSRNIAGTTLKGSNLAGTGNRPLVAGADGTIDDQDAATFRGTIGALAATDPVFTGALKQGAATRVTAGGGAWFASIQATNLVGAGDRPIAADLTGTIQPKTPDQFRNMISALSATLKGAANGVAELGADGRVPSGQLPPYLTLGETAATAHRGDHGVIAYNHSQATGNPHGTTAADVGAAKAPSKQDVSASTTIGSIDATAVKVTTTDVILTLSGGVDGQGWDIINPTASTGIAIPSGATLWKSIGSNVGPTTIALGGGRPIRITRIDANTWTMLGSQ